MKVSALQDLLTVVQEKCLWQAAASVFPSPLPTPDDKSNHNRTQDHESDLKRHHLVPDADLHLSSLSQRKRNRLLRDVTAVLKPRSRTGSLAPGLVSLEFPGTRQEERGQRRHSGPGRPLHGRQPSDGLVTCPGEPSSKNRNNLGKGSNC
ncbi:hypothetical protein C0Q70_06283 [Pomacea canaliculata]|uniref:Uncharacterized protein n=1 Tax=Pomacea canaliculata TaxID=400727 RepID=A0A2T7PNM0_POMCA|nr:hypothetical protein C0Q70_06283 [Pomacea canaliculata]